MPFRYDKYNYEGLKKRNVDILMTFLIPLLLLLPAMYLCTTLSFAQYDNTWGISDYLINYEGGFVRRGLIGEILYLCHDLAGINPLILIYLLSFVCYFAVVGVLVSAVKKKNMAWWIVFALPLCGYIGDIVRKDYLMYLMLTGLTLLAEGLHSDKIQSGRMQSRSDLPRIMMMFLIITFTMLCHEGFIFFGLSVCCLYIFNVSGKRVPAVALGIWGCILFGIASLAKGNGSVVIGISESLNGIGFPPEVTQGGSIDALQWDLKETMLMHLKLNFKPPYYNAELPAGAYWVIGILSKIILWLAVYYLMINLPAVFTRGKNEGERIQKRDNIGGLLLLTMLTMLPMMTVLCCDRNRVLQFWVMGAYIPAMLLPGAQVARILPDRFMQITHRVNNTLTKIIAPHAWILILLYISILLLPVVTYFRKLAGVIPY